LVPSPLRSGVSVTFQFGSVSRTAPDDKLTPLINHIAVEPVAALYHSRSALPSPLKSAVAITFQFVSVSRTAPDDMLPPLINHIAVEPVAALYHSKSALPSPLKSEAAPEGVTLFDAADGAPAPARLVAVTVKV